MSFAVVSGVVGVGSAAYSIYNSERQRRESKIIRESAVDPGIQRNYGLERTRDILADNYSNFNLPGFTRYREQIASNQASANARIRDGATSSEDILAGSVATQASANSATQNLYTTQAQSRLQALGDYLNSVNAVGQDQVRVNQLDLGRYEQTMREAAALEGASQQNLNTGLQDLVMGLQPMLSSFQPTTTINPNTGEVVTGPSRHQQFWKRK